MTPKPSLFQTSHTAGRQVGKNVLLNDVAPLVDAVKDDIEGILVEQA